MQTTGFLFAIFAAMTWGLAYTIDQKILSTNSPLLLVFFSGVLTVFVTLPALLLNNDFKSIVFLERRTVFLIIIAQLLALIANYCILSGIKILGASTASIFEITYPIFVIIFSLFAYGGHLNVYFWIGSSLMFLGSALVITKA